MYKPANIREFVTPATYKSMGVQIVEGRTVKTIVSTSTIKGKFKQKSTGEIYANGLTVVTEKTTFITWWKSSFKAGDILTINGIDFLVKGEPENVEMRSRYAVITLERIEGGA